MIELSSTGEVLAAIRRGNEIAIEAYTLHGPVLDAAEEAARRGASVAVRLEGRPYDDRNGRLASENARLAAQLRDSGARVTLEQSLHAKEISVDGTRYLDGKNWHLGDIVVRESDASAGAIPTTKHEALRREAELVKQARASDGVVVESESFGCCNEVYEALRTLGRSGAAPRLIVSEAELRGNRRERRVLGELASAGVRVRVSNDTEKLAAAGGRVWLGSANATVAYGKCDMADWGVCTSDSRIARSVRDRLEGAWQSAKNFDPRVCTPAT